MTKRTTESAGDADAKMHKTGSEEEPAAPLGPFGEPTEHRSFQITVEGKPIYVNLHLLAEVSPFFDTLCLGDFKEGKGEKAELKDVKYDDVIEMLTVLGADYSKDRKYIDESNCVAMLKLASMWQFDVLKKRCINYIEDSFPEDPTTFASTLELLIACEETKVPKAALKHVASRLASFDPDLIMQEDNFSRIQDKGLSGTIVRGAKKHQLARQSRPVHSYEKVYYEDCGDGRSECRRNAVYGCLYCGKFVCQRCRDVEEEEAIYQYRALNQGKMESDDEDEVYPVCPGMAGDKSAVNAKLDKRFFAEPEEK